MSDPDDSPSSPLPVSRRQDWPPEALALAARLEGASDPEKIAILAEHAPEVVRLLVEVRQEVHRGFEQVEVRASLRHREVMTAIERVSVEEVEDVRQRVGLIESQIAVLQGDTEVRRKNDSQHDLAIGETKKALTTQEQHTAALKSAAATLERRTAQLDRRVGVWSALFFLGGLLAQLLIRALGGH